MKIRKYMTIALAATMLTLVGCGNKNDSSSSVADIPASAEATTKAEEATSTAVEVKKTKAENTATETTPTTEPATEETTEPAVSSMAFADIENAFSTIMAEQLNKPADSIEDRESICDSYFEGLEAAGFTFSSYPTSDKFGRNGRFSDKDSSVVDRALEEKISITDFEDAAYFGTCVVVKAPGVKQDYFISANLFIDTGVKERYDYEKIYPVYEKVFRYFIDNGYTDRGDGETTLAEALKAVQNKDTEAWLRCELKNDQFSRVTIMPYGYLNTISIIYYM